MPDGHGVIVVGVDATPHSRAALAFALDEAARNGDTVQVVTAWSLRPPPVAEPVVLASGMPASADEVAERAAAVQQEVLDQVAPGGAPVPLARQLVEGEAGRVLVAASRGARLLVVGTRALGPLRAALLGSVSRYCARHAECPVVVVPDHHEDRTPDTGDLVSATGDTLRQGNT